MKYEVGYSCVELALTIGSLHLCIETIYYIVGLALPCLMPHVKQRGLQKSVPRGSRCSLEPDMKERLGHRSLLHINPLWGIEPLYEEGLKHLSISRPD